MGVATTRYRWLGFGPWIDPMVVEYMLVTEGRAAFTYVQPQKGEPRPEVGRPLFDDNGPMVDLRGRDGAFTKRVGGLAVAHSRFTVTRVTPGGFLDDTYTPSSYTTMAPTGAGGINFTTFGPLEGWRGVPIWGDNLRSQYDLNTIITWSKILAEAALVVQNNMRKTMVGTVVFAPQDKLKTAQVTLEGVKRGIDVMVADTAIIEGIKDVNFGVHPDSVEKSHMVLMRLWAEALEALGVESPVNEKKERITVSEVDGDNSQVSAVRRMTLTPRRQAASLINRRFFGGAPVIEVIDQWE